MKELLLAVLVSYKYQNDFILQWIFCDKYLFMEQKIWKSQNLPAKDSTSIARS